MTTGDPRVHAEKSPPLPNNDPLTAIVCSANTALGVIEDRSISDDLAKRAMGQTASSLAEGIAEQTNDYFFCAFCGALLEVASPRPATPTIVLRAHLFRLCPPSRRFGPPERSS